SGRLWIRSFRKRRTAWYLFEAMGFEYRFDLRPSDRERLAANPAVPHSLDALLRGAPGFIEQRGTTYSFARENAAADDWAEAVSIESYGLYVCVYERQHNRLMDYLIYKLLEVCGHVGVSEL